MANGNEARAEEPDPFDAVDLDAVLAHATEPDGEGGSPLGAAVVALVARCVAVVEGDGPPPQLDARRVWRHPATAVLLLGARFMRILQEEDPPATVASAAHVGMCLLLMYVESSEEAKRGWTAVTAQEEFPWPIRLKRRLLELEIRDAEGTLDPPHDPIEDFLREQVEAAGDDGRAPRRLREVARRAVVGSSAAGSDSLLVEIDDAIRQIERGGLEYGIDREPKPGRFYCRKEGAHPRLYCGDKALFWLERRDGKRHITLGNAQGRLFMALALGRVPDDKDLRARPELRSALERAGSTVVIVGKGAAMKFDRGVVLDRDLIDRWKAVQRGDP